MHRRCSVVVLLCLCALAAPAFLAAQSLGTAKPAGKEPTLTIGGLLQVQAEFGDRGDTRFGSDNDRFYLRRARLNASGKFLEEFDFRVEGDFAGTLANTSALRAQLTDGYVTWNRYPEANVRTEIGTAGLSWYFKSHDLKFLVNYLHVRNEGQDDQGKLLARMQVIF
jgi:phosphate-selective porin